MNLLMLATDTEITFSELYLLTLWSFWHFTLQCLYAFDALEKYM